MDKQKLEQIKAGMADIATAIERTKLAVYAPPFEEPFSTELLNRFSNLNGAFYSVKNFIEVVIENPDPN